MSEFSDFLAAVADGKKRTIEENPGKRLLKDLEKRLHESASPFEIIQEPKVEPKLEIIQEQELVIEPEVKESPLLQEVVVPEVKPAAQQYPIADIDKYLKQNASFQQPNPDKVAPNFQEIQTKLKFLEQAIGKIAATGPGSGEVNLRWLDDIDRSTIANGKYLRYNESTGKFDFNDVSAGTYILPTATTSVLGGVKIDGTSITISNGVISAAGSSYSLPTASASVLGGVKVGTGLSIDSGTGILSSTITQYSLPIASDTVLGGVKVGTGLSINSTTGILAASVGDITSVDGTVIISTNGSGVHDLSVASSVSSSVQNVFAYVTNDDTVAITKGQPVYLYRATGNRPSVILARNTSDQYSAKTLGLAAGDINPGNPGWVQTQGVLTGVDTQAYNEGDTLYLGSTAGTMTSTKPYAPNHLVYIGVVVRANQGQGQIYIKPQNGYELDEIHDADIGHTYALATGQTIVWNATRSVWENKQYAYSNLTGTPTIPAAQIQSDWNQTTNTALDYIKNKPTLFDGAYSSLTGTPTIPAAQIQSDWTQASTSALDYIKNKPTLAAVATSGLYSSLTGTPTFLAPRVSATTTTSSLTWTSASYDVYELTAQSGNLTISIDSATTPVNGQKNIFRVRTPTTGGTFTMTQTGSKRFRLVGVSIPTNLTAGNILYIGCQYNSTDSTWDVIAVREGTI